METKVKAKFIRMSPKKVRLVAGLIRGLDVVEAETQLAFNKKIASEPILKLLKSAVSNAEENHELKKDNLFIKTIFVDEGPTLKRWRPRAFGRAGAIMKRTSHINLVLAEKVPTTEKKDQKKIDTKDDLVKVGDLTDLKDEISVDGKDKIKEPVKKERAGVSDKGFVGKIFNRKSGQK